jgi:hypothetical protein
MSVYGNLYLLSCYKARARSNHALKAWQKAGLRPIGLHEARHAPGSIRTCDLPRWQVAGQRINVAVEACTDSLFVCNALVAAGAVPHRAEPVETRALRGRKGRAKTAREDAR